MVEIIDPTNELFTYVKQEVEAQLKSDYPNITCKQIAEDTLASTSLPFLLFKLADNPMYEKTQDSGSLENHVQSMFEVDVFAAEPSKLNTCKKIMNIVDVKMQSYGFIRKFGPQQTQNLSDTSICRLTARYQGVVSKKGTEYTVYRK